MCTDDSDEVGVPADSFGSPRMEGGDEVGVPADSFGSPRMEGGDEVGVPADSFGSPLMEKEDVNGVNENWLYGEETYLIRGGLFTVHNEVGLGRSEEAYHQAFKEWLEEKSIPFHSKPAHPLFLSGKRVHTLYPDFVLWDKITLELKAIAGNLTNQGYVQIYNYLKYRGDQLGLLVNMGMDRVQVERIANTRRGNKELTCDLGEWESPAPVCSRKVLDSLYAIHSQHSTGYGQEISTKLVLAAFLDNDIGFKQNPLVRNTYKSIPLPDSTLDCLVVENDLVCCYTSLHDSNVFNIHRARSFMSTLNLPFGIAVNFGKHHMEIKGLRHGV